MTYNSPYCFVLTASNMSLAIFISVVSVEGFCRYADRSRQIDGYTCSSSLAMKTLKNLSDGVEIRDRSATDRNILVEPGLLQT